jgi:hypothetical protein
MSKFTNKSMKLKHINFNISKSHFHQVINFHYTQVDKTVEIFEFRGFPHNFGNGALALELGILAAFCPDWEF